MEALKGGTRGNQSRVGHLMDHALQDVLAVRFTLPPANPQPQCWGKHRHWYPHSHGGNGAVMGLQVRTGNSSFHFYPSHSNSAAPARWQVPASSFEWEELPEHPKILWGWWMPSSTILQASPQCLNSCTEHSPFPLPPQCHNVMSPLLLPDPWDPQLCPCWQGCAGQSLGTPAGSACRQQSGTAIWPHFAPVPP